METIKLNISSERKKVLIELFNREIKLKDEYIDNLEIIDADVKNYEQEIEREAEEMVLLCDMLDELTKQDCCEKCRYCLEDEDGDSWCGFLETYTGATDICKHFVEFK